MYFKIKPGHIKVPYIAEENYDEDPEILIVFD